MIEILETAMAPVLADIGRTGAPVPRLGEPEVEHAGVMVMLWHSDGSGSGVFVSDDEGPSDRVVRAADMTQAWVIEQLWGSANTAWPACPRHPGTHPVWPELVDERAMWVCPRDDIPVAAIGALGLARA